MLGKLFQYLDINCNQKQSENIKNLIRKNYTVRKFVNGIEVNNNIQLPNKK